MPIQCYALDMFVQGRLSKQKQTSFIWPEGCKSLRFVHEAGRIATAWLSDSRGGAAMMIVHPMLVLLDRCANSMCVSKAIL